MLKKVVAALIVNGGGQLLVLRRHGQESWVLPGHVMENGETEQDCLHRALSGIGIAFDYARLVGQFSGYGLPHWPEVELICFQPHKFTLFDELQLGLEWIEPEDLATHQVTEVEKTALRHFDQQGLWPVPVALKAAV